MKANQKTGFGSVLAVFGGIGIILGPLFGLTDLNDPWSFIAGLIVGLMAGTGVALSIYGLQERRRNISGNQS